MKAGLPPTLMNLSRVQAAKVQRIEATRTSPYVKLMGHDVVLANGIPEANLDALKDIILKSPMGDEPIGQDIIRALVELQVRRAQENMNAGRLKAFIKEVAPKGLFDIRSAEKPAN